MSVELPKCILDKIDREFAKPTRIHPMRSSMDNSLWVKREDELSSGISGSKLRKYASLIPHLKKNQIKRVALIGGPNSNNLLGLIQLLRECSVKPVLFLREAGDERLQGNALFIKMLINEDECVSVSRSDWGDVENLAVDYLRSLPKDDKALLLKEGCYGPEALPGAMSLAEDILRNEREQGIRFDKIYIDSGTGLTAIGLVLGLDILSSEKASDRSIVVSLIAGDEAGFLENLEAMRKHLRSDYQIEFAKEHSLRFLRPTLSPKFGSCNNSLFKACREIAKTEGLLMDPVYSVKHYDAMINDLEKQGDAKSLFVFNGSALGLAGFQQQLMSSF